jgi:outer membrane protein OmpA-like peptidoglycan-associated protein
VVAALRALKVDPARLVVESYGFTRPIADDATKELGV